MDQNELIIQNNVVLGPKRRDIAEAIIPNHVIEIAPFAFRACGALQNVVMNDNVTKIGAGAFKDCVNLQSVKLSNAITCIEHALFCGCWDLRKVNIPSRLISIGDKAFADTMIPAFELPDSVTHIGDFAFIILTV